MKNVTKILAVLLCAFMVFSLAACGGDEDTESKDTKDTQAVSDTTSGDSETEKTGDKETGGDGIILPEDAKITFGKDNKKSEDTTGTGTDGSGKDGSAKPGGKDPGKDPGKSDDNSKSTGGNTSEPSKPTGGNSSETTKPSGGDSSETTEQGGDNYGGIQWNN